MPPAPIFQKTLSTLSKVALKICPFKAVISILKGLCTHSQNQNRPKSQNRFSNFEYTYDAKTVGQKI